jgi:NhaA family Na+:H+ antiporter
VVGAGMLGGIGFTMSLFVANLAVRITGFGNEAKMMIFVASAIAGGIGYCWLRFVVPPPTLPSPDQVLRDSIDNS